MAETFAAMTAPVTAVAGEVCGGRLVMARESGGSDVCVPFRGRATVAMPAGSGTLAPDSFTNAFARRQPGPAFEAFGRDERRDSGGAGIRSGSGAGRLPDRARS